jgi:hypothetical protein
LDFRVHQTRCGVEVHGQSTAQDNLLGQRVTYTPSSGLCREMLVGAIRWDGYAQLCHSRWAHVFVSVDLSRHTEVPYTVLQPCVMLTATTNSQVVGAVFRDCSTCIGASLPMLPLGIRASSEEICEKNVACMLYW